MPVPPALADDQLYRSHEDPGSWSSPPPAPSLHSTTNVRSPVFGDCTTDALFRCFLANDFFFELFFRARSPSYSRFAALRFFFSVPVATCLVPRQYPWLPADGVATFVVLARLPLPLSAILSLGTMDPAAISFFSLMVSQAFVLRGMLGFGSPRMGAIRGGVCARSHPRRVLHPADRSAAPGKSHTLGRPYRDTLLFFRLMLSFAV